MEDDQDVPCALGDVPKSDSPASDNFDLVAGYYNFDKELLQADQHLFNRFKKIHVEKSIKTAAEVIDVLHVNTLYEIAPDRVPKGFRFPGLRAKKCRAPGLQDENFRALGLHIICFRSPGSTVVYNLDI